MIGAIHKLRHTLRGAEGVDEVWHCVTRGDPKYYDITFQKLYEGNITRINQIETIPLKNIEHCTLNNLTNIHVMTFIVHLAQ